MANIMKVAYRQSLLNPKVRSLKLDLISDDIRRMEIRRRQDTVPRVVITTKGHLVPIGKRLDGVVKAVGGEVRGIKAATWPLMPLFSRTGRPRAGCCRLPAWLSIDLTVVLSSR
jgi:hypothetical protein